MIAIVLGVCGACALALVALRRRFLTVTVSGRSMEPTLRHGDRVLVRRTGVGAVRAGELAVMAAPPGTGRDWMVKRVIAVPGDPVPREAVPALARTRDPAVPADRLVVVGDNLALSLDSRGFGYVHARQLLGVVVRHLPRSPSRHSAGR
ncbi:signal peptidase I [Streptosporangium carneum]|uniref:Signal peptidase I n=1 Tax=Streptosporangium carneum TaxID=47481 RepID=A0A9W6MBY3_9ACTN|nr:signal peptidase I [Streptosporangium carneum]GLK08829.1 S26 family signal peptidase [Streptosporangium carneum]